MSQVVEEVIQKKQKKVKPEIVDYSSSDTDDDEFESEIEIKKKEKKQPSADENVTALQYLMMMQKDIEKIKRRQKQEKRQAKRPQSKPEPVPASVQHEKDLETIKKHMLMRF